MHNTLYFTVYDMVRILYACTDRSTHLLRAPYSRVFGPAAQAWLCQEEYRDLTNYLLLLDENGASAAHIGILRNTSSSTSTASVQRSLGIDNLVIDYCHNETSKVLLAIDEWISERPQ